MVVVVVLDVAVVAVDVDVVVGIKVVVDSAAILVEVDVVVSADVSHAKPTRASDTTRAHLGTDMIQT